MCKNTHDFRKNVEHQHEIIYSPKENVISSTYSINYVLAYGSHVGRGQDVPSLTILIYDTPITIFSNLNFNFVSYVK